MKVLANGSFYVYLDLCFNHLHETTYIEKSRPGQSEDKWKMEFLVFFWILIRPRLESRLLV